MSDQIASELTFLGITVPNALRGVAYARKYQSEKSWTLTTKKGCIIGSFVSELELENWWKLFQETQGRIAHPLINARYTKPIRSETVTYSNPFHGSNLQDWDLD
ncbi:hypothetical protein EP7_002282 [Isosphaeraceae bacterium EP7]